jgi:hypothetical protein
VLLNVGHHWNVKYVRIAGWSFYLTFVYFLSFVVPDDRQHPGREKSRNHEIHEKGAMAVAIVYSGENVRIMGACFDFGWRGPGPAPLGAGAAYGSILISVQGNALRSSRTPARVTWVPHSVTVSRSFKSFR